MNTDLSQTNYFTLVQAFLETAHSSITKEDFEKQEGVVEMSTETLVLRIIPHALVENEVEPGAAVIEVDLMLLDLDNREVNHDRFLILHQLNAVSRFTTGIIAFITQEGMLSVSKIVSLASLNGETFSQEVAQVLHAAESLYDGWNHLADLAEENRDGEQESVSTNADIIKRN
ncbi:MAG: hypothetical protein FJ390_02610 [Verrucomicrobia bacterium]|nr:hypothetical protein [Verrucomicrobiota bacterium]